MMQLVINVQIVGENYHNLATRDLIIRDLAGPNDVAHISYDVGRMVGPLLQTLARQLEPQTDMTGEAVELIE